MVVQTFETVKKFVMKELDFVFIQSYGTQNQFAIL